MTLHVSASGRNLAMPSLESQAIADAWRFLMARIAALPGPDMAAIRDMTEATARLAAEPTGVTYEEQVVAQLPSLWCRPQGARPGAVIVYLHGGGYNNQSKDTVRKLAAHLAKAAGLDAVVPDYRLAPENPWPAPLLDARAVVRALREDASPPTIVLAGESSGGSLAISTALALRDAAEPQVAAVVAFSPYVDLLGESPAFSRSDSPDLFLSRPMAELAAGMLLGQNTPATDPTVNLIHADPHGLPPLFLCTGGDENLAAPVADFAARAQDAGVQVRSEIVAGMQHAFVYMAGRAPEADATIADAAAWLTAILP